MKQKYGLLFGLVTILLFASCQSETDPVPIELMTGTVASQPELGRTTPLPLSTTPVIMEVETASSLADLDPTPSVTAISDTTIPRTPTIVAATLTPLPTLEGKELEAAIAELLANPMNCDVPCWWGFIPGITNVMEVKQTISPYGFDISEYYDEEGNLYIYLGIGYVPERNDFEIRTVFWFSGSILAGVTAYSPSVSEILTKYGQPDEIWIETAISPEPIPVRLNLVYLQGGMAIGYVTDGNVENGMFKGCFADKETGRLSLVVPNSATNYRELSTIFEKDRQYLPLELATGLTTMNEFMERFSDPTQPQCIETPLELWE